MTNPTGKAYTKGERGGPCNRTACQKPGATWWNPSTRAYYCEGCALLINQHNGPLCISPLNMPPVPSLVEVPAADAKLAEMEARKDAAYEERNRVVAALAKCFPSGIAKTAIEGWSEDWHGCVYIDLPTGQASWHFHDSQAYLFEGLPAYTKGWDFHSTEEKYQRLAALVPAADAGAVGRLVEFTDAEIEVGRRAVEETLVDFRNSRISVLNRGNGLAIREADGRESSIIRVSTDAALIIATRAINEHRAALALAAPEKHGQEKQ